MTRFISSLEKRSETHNQGAHNIMDNILNVLTYKLNILADRLSYKPSKAWGKHWLNPLLSKCKKRLCPLWIYK
jgi:hypothetical protein